MAMMAEVRGEVLLRRLPNEVRASLTSTQETALLRAVADNEPLQHPVDIRLSLPLPWRRYYLVLLSGTERRSDIRLASERVDRPLATAGNFIFIGLAAGVMSGLFLIAILLASAVIEF